MWKVLHVFLIISIRLRVIIVSIMCFRILWTCTKTSQTSGCDSAYIASVRRFCGFPKDTVIYVAIFACAHWCADDFVPWSPFFYTRFLRDEPCFTLLALQGFTALVDLCLGEVSLCTRGQTQHKQLRLHDEQPLVVFFLMQFSTAALRASCQMASLRLTASLIRPFSPAGRSVFFRSVESGQLHAGAVSLKACNHWGYSGGPLQRFIIMSKQIHFTILLKLHLLGSWRAFSRRSSRFLGKIIRTFATCSTILALNFEI